MTARRGINTLDYVRSLERSNLRPSEIVFLLGVHVLRDDGTVRLSSISCST
jgi:hypothetical protein